MMTSRLIAGAMVVAVTACSTHYVPQRPGHVAVTMRGGRPVYVRDGQTFEHGLLGGKLVEAVAGNPAAMAAAREYHDRMETGLVMTLAGLGLMVGGMAVSVGELAQENHNQAAGIAALVALGGMVLMLGGAGYTTTAEPYRWDAINIFNDAPEPPAAAPPGWNAFAHKQTLRMRD